MNSKHRRLILLLVVLPLALLSWSSTLYFGFLAPLPELDNLGIEIRTETGAMVIKGVKEKDRDGRQTPAFSAGLQPGDVLLAMGPVQGALTPLTSMIRYRNALFSIPEGTPVRLRWARTLPPDKVIEKEAILSPPRTQMPLATLLTALLLATVLPGLVLFTAFFIGFQKPEDDSAFAAALLFLGFFTIFGSNSFLLPPLLSFPVSLFHWIFNPLVSFLFLKFFLTFPSPSLIQRRFPWIQKAAGILFGFGALLTTAISAVDRFTFRWNPALHSVAQGLSPLLSLLMTAAALIGLAALASNTIKAPTRDDRRRLVIILAATLAWVLPLISFLFYYGLTQKEPPLWLMLVLGLILALFPLSFIYSIVKHRVMGLSLILRKGIRYAMVSKGFLVIEGGLIFTALFYSTDPLRRRIAPHANSGEIAVASAATTILTAFALSRINRRILPKIDRRFFREAFNTQQLLSDLAQAIRQLSSHPDRLLQVITDQLSVTLHPDHVGIFLCSTEPAAPNTSRPLLAFGERSDPAAPFRCFRHRMRLEHQENTIYSHADFSAFVLARDSLIGRKLAEAVGPGDEPKALDVYLDDPRSWVQPIAAASPDAPHIAAERELLTAFNTRLLVPIAQNERLIGFFSLGEKLSEEPYTKEDKQLLLMVAHQSAIAIENAQLLRQVAKQERLQRELEIAQEVQDSLFPQHPPQIAGLDYCGICRPARGVGGDYFDFVALTDGKLGIALGDVSGKGISAALLMANLQATVRSHAVLRGDAVELLVSDVNGLLSASTHPGKYATFFYGVFHPAACSLSFVNAGHNPPLLFPGTAKQTTDILRAEAVGPAGSRRLTAGGIPIGLFEDAHFEQQQVPFEPGDLLVIYTDGVSEARNQAQEEYGEARLAEVIAQNRGKTAAEIQQAILADLDRFSAGMEPHDDVTLVVVCAGS